MNFYIFLVFDFRFLFIDINVACKILTISRLRIIEMGIKVLKRLKYLIAV